MTPPAPRTASISAPPAMDGLPLGDVDDEVDTDAGPAALGVLAAARPAQAEPAGLAQPEPAGLAQPEPAGLAQPEPAGLAQAEPAVDDGLTERERQILAFERQWWRHAGAKEQAIRDLFEVSSTRYYQLVNALLDKPEALAYDPVLVRRLRRLRATRARARGSRA